MVGAVVVDDEGVVVGRGSHEAAGEPHAEILRVRRRRRPGARRDALLHARAVLSHRADRARARREVVRAGIRRAVIAIEDPNPLVSGRGLAYLRQHDVDGRRWRPARGG